MDKAETSAPIAATPNSEPAAAKHHQMRLPVGPLTAEVIGTFILTAFVISTKGEPFFIFVAFAGLNAMLGAASGAHLNPAITFAAALMRRLTPLRALGYILAQVLGAMLAFIVLTALLGGSQASVNPYTGESVAPALFKLQELVEGKEWYAFFASLLGTTILGYGVANALSEKRERFTASFSAAAGLFAGLIIAGSTAVLNPAVAIAVQALTFDYWNIAVHAIAPLIGATVGFLVFKLVQHTTGAKEVVDKTTTA